MTTKDHWEKIYTAKQPDQVSWYQAQPQVSLSLIRLTGVALDAPIIDVGGGASTLVDFLLDTGYSQVTVFDIAAAALETARARLGSRASRAAWIEGDILQADLPASGYSLWHDRAVFHFLTRPQDRARYVEVVRRALKPGGHIIVASFAPDGPPQCSGLDVMRYSPDGLHGEFGDDFTLLQSQGETHQTPFGTVQKFVYCYCRKR